MTSPWLLFQNWAIDLMGSIHAQKERMTAALDEAKEHYAIGNLSK
jgi:hypothetical protein